MRLKFIKKKIEVLKLKHKRNGIEYKLFKLYKEDFNSSEIFKFEKELAKVNQLLFNLTDSFE